MDSMLLIVLAILLVVILLALFSCCIYCDYRYYRTFMILKNKVFWNVFIRYTLQSYLKMSFTAFVSIQLMESGNRKRAFSSVLAIGTVVFLVVAPGLYAFILWKKQKDLFLPTVRDRIGSLYQGKREEETSGRVFVVIYLLRRLWFVLLTLTLVS